MDVSPIFDEPLLKRQEAGPNVIAWPEVLKTYKSGKNKDTILAVMNYIQPDVVKKTGNADQSEFNIPHGSIQLHVILRDDTYAVSAPFVRLPEKNPLILMRQVTEMNFSSLRLAQVRLAEDLLSMEFESPLELCEPWKLYEVFEEICRMSDNNDDFFIEKFGARPVTERSFEHFPTDMAELARKRFQSYLDEAFRYLKDFAGTSSQGYNWDILHIHLNKIAVMISPQGFLRPEIENSISALYGKSPFNERVSAGKDFLEKLRALPGEKLDTCLYASRFFISPKNKSGLVYVQDTLKQTRENTRQEISRHDFVGATLGMEVGILGILRKNILPPQIDRIFWAGLRNASGKPWKESAETLFESLESVMTMKSEVPS